jgi:hypothetical protein
MSVKRPNWGSYSTGTFAEGVKQPLYQPVQKGATTGD